MSDHLKIGVVGLGKMGLSHFAMVNPHPLTDTIACDQPGFVTDVLSKNISAPVVKGFDALMADEALQAVIIATPSKLHAPMVRTALERGLHVFCEKPFCLDWTESLALSDLAEEKGLVNRVGYHYRHVGAFAELKRIVDSGALGHVTHVLAEAYGPVVLRTKSTTWRTDKTEGGGCLYDYAAHPLNLLNWYFGTPAQVMGSDLGHVFSEATDDQVMSTLRFENGPTAQLSVNWSDESHRKMSTKITLMGTKGRAFADRQECQVYLRETDEALPEYGKGWTVKYTTEMTQHEWFYLRGEEYSAQIARFVEAAAAGKDSTAENTFRSATETDKTMAMIIENAETGLSVGEAPTPVKPEPRKRGWLRR
jgi:predicted dehydrogenase